jgi:guanylate kinase
MEGKLFIFCAPSGSGKTTIVNYLMNQGLGLAFSISATSRSPRSGEKDGREYYFISPDEFLRRISINEFIEWEEVYPGQFYGTLRSELERIWGSGQHALFDLDVEGGINLKRLYGDRALSVFVMPPSLEVLGQRLRARGTEDEVSLARRLGKAGKEMDRAPEFDRVLVNDSLEIALREAKEIVTGFLFCHP